MDVWCNAREWEWVFYRSIYAILDLNSRSQGLVRYVLASTYAMHQDARSIPQHVDICLIMRDVRSPFITTSQEAACHALHIQYVLVFH